MVELKRELCCWVLCLVLLGTVAASAEPIYLRNKPFKGPSSGAGKDTMVGLTAFAAAMDLVVTEQNGSKVAYPKDAGTVTDFGINEPGHVFVVGKEVRSAVDPSGEVMVSLWDAAEAAGARVVLNRDLGTIEVNLMVKAVTAPGSAAGAGASTPVAPLNINKPGQEVTIAQHLISGKTNIVVFGAKW
ncbi:MAG: hypothetical protein HY319_01795 [Armatimonadetes bacterium]|nr:hypothetical protein [Armatimonadota bacterium]